MSLARVGFVIGTAALSFKFLKPETKAQLRRQVSAGLRLAANTIDPNYKQPMWADNTKKEVDDASIQHEIEDISLEIEVLLNDEDDTDIPSNKERTFRGFRTAN